MEQYNIFNTLTERTDPFPFESSILIALREPGSQKNMAIEGETFLLNLPSSRSLGESSRKTLSLFVKKCPLSTLDRNFGLI